MVINEDNEVNKNDDDKTIKKSAKFQIISEVLPS